MSEPRRLMAVLAHPDDESLGVGGTLARYASEGAEVYLVTATRGERGRYGDGNTHPGEDAVGKVRESELRAAARELGVRDVQLLDYIDGDLDRADPREAIGRIVAQLRRARPQVVVTFDPLGAYGHPDHVAISQFTTAALVAAADPTFDPGTPAHRVSKLYYMIATAARSEAYQATFKRLISKVDGVERGAHPWPDWSVTSRLDTAAVWPIVWKAVQCHWTQIAAYRKLAELPPEHHAALWGSQEYYRALSLVNGGRALETDLFEGVD